MDADLRSEIAERLNEAASAYDWAVWLDQAAQHFKRTDFHVSASRYRRLFDHERSEGLLMLQKRHQSRPSRRGESYRDLIA